MGSTGTAIHLMRWLAVLTALLSAAVPASAHFELNANIRVIHVEHLDDGLRLYLRLPMPYLVAHLLGPEDADGEPEAAPYTINYRDAGKLLHSFDVDRFLAAPLGLGRLAAEGHRLTVEGRALAPEVEAVRAYPAYLQAPFADLAEARAAFDGPLYPEDEAASFVGDTVVDVGLRYRSDRPVRRYAFSSTLDPGLPGQAETENLLLDDLDGELLIFRKTGLLLEPIEVSRSPAASAWGFLLQGIRHILEGLDHVLFVLCLTIGAAGLVGLLWRVTGFTLGHSVTLIAGFFGLAPGAAWFVPAVETGIALSIVYAAVVALRPRGGAGGFVVAAAIGLLHGLGFSFLLRNLLALESPQLWPSLLSFNLGVEIGQVAIVLLVWPALVLLARRSAPAASYARWGIALPCIAVALFWVAERGTQVVATL